MIKTCSVCKWFTVNTEDPLADKIKERHAENHLVRNFADGGKRNIIIGVVEWI